MPPSGEMVGQKRQIDKPIAKEKDEPENAADQESLERFLEGWDAHHGVDVAGGIDKTGNPDDRSGEGKTRPPFDGNDRFPQSFPGHGPPPPYSKSPYPYYPTTSVNPGTPITPTPSSLTTSDDKIHSETSICLTDTDTYTAFTRSSGGYSPDLIAESSEGGITYKTVTADSTGTVTDTATIVLSGKATKGIFPEHDRATPEPGTVANKVAQARLRDILLGVFLGAGMVIFIVVCIFLCRRYKRKKRRTSVALDNRSDAEQTREQGPEMQTTRNVVTMASLAPASSTDILPPPPPFTSHAESTPPTTTQDLTLSGPEPPQIPIIINPFTDPTYNSSSGIEDYVVSNHAPLGREPENPFLHPDDRSMETLDHPRPNSAGDFPPEYTTVDGNPIDASGRRIREERFPFGDEALSLRTESETGSVRNASLREEIPQYQYDDPNGVADGFRYDPAASGRFPR